MSEQTKWKHDETVRSELAAFIAQHELTQSEMASRLHLTTTRLTKYLNLHKPENQPEPDAPRVEREAKNFLRHLRRRSTLSASLFPNSVSKSVSGVLRFIRRTGDVGLIHSLGGVGKTCAAEIFARENSNTLFLTATMYACGSRAIGRKLFEEYRMLSGERCPAQSPRAEWLEEQLRGSECLIIVDNAQRLDISAFKWLLDFHDATFCPICFIGNTEVLAKLRQYDTERQLITRIGIVQPVKLHNDEAETAEKLVKQIFPESGEALLEDATNVLGSVRNARTLRKQLVLGREIWRGQTEKNFTKAFAAAGERLLKP